MPELYSRLRTRTLFGSFGERQAVAKLGKQDLPKVPRRDARAAGSIEDAFEAEPKYRCTSLSAKGSHAWLTSTCSRLFLWARSAHSAIISLGLAAKLWSSLWDFVKWADAERDEATFDKCDISGERAGRCHSVSCASSCQVSSNEESQNGKSLIWK